MTIVTEYRWRCNLCGNVSPPLQIGEYPTGWVQNIDMFYAHISLEYDRHFCCDNHRQQWEKLNEDTH